MKLFVWILIAYAAVVLLAPWLRAGGLYWARLWHAVGLRVYLRQPWRVAWDRACRRFV